MDKIVRTTTKATGGITPEENLRLDEHAKVWISRAMRTAPIEPDKIIPAVKSLYAAAGLKEPRVVIAPSPLVMAFAYGASAAIWHGRKANATDSATDSATANATRSATASATHSATRSATYNATYSATDSATDSATRSATYSATDSATHSATDSATASAESGAAKACFDLAGHLGLQCATRWGINYQGGNMWAGYDCYLSAWRDVIGLKLPEHEKYAVWEQCAIHGGFRVLHPEFCIVSDFPEFVRVDDLHRPHCADGPSHRWRDGWSLYHWHGVKVPAHWIEQRDTLTASEIFKEQNAETRRAGCEIIGWDRVLDGINAKMIDDDGDPLIGALYEGTIPGATKCTFLKVQCGTGRTFVIPTAPGLKSAIAAQLWIRNHEIGGETSSRNHPVDAAILRRLMPEVRG